jgi:rhodanese-related sulfurtransferase
MGYIDGEGAFVVPEVDLKTFGTARAAGALVVDVREPGEFRAGHVLGAKLMPLATMPARRGELPTDRPVYVICATGNRSLTAARWRAAGIEAYSVAGGTQGWTRMGRPVVTGPRRDAA